MPCVQCKSEFKFLNWKIQCYECELFFCSKCLKKSNGKVFCEKCTILNKRPPDRSKLMELKSKDIQAYLQKRYISTHGFVEKSEIVDLFYKTVIPSHPKKSSNSFSSLFGGSVPNLITNTEEKLNKVASNLETNINNLRDYAEAAYSNILHPNISGGSNFYNTATNNTTINNRSGLNANTSPQSTPSASNIDNLQRRASENDILASSSQTNVQNKETVESQLKFIKLSDLKSIEDIEKLSGKQLKQILALNRVNYKGVLEKNELLEKVVNLWIESHRVDESGDADETDDCCKICMDAPLECVILECGHIATCVECGKQLSECPICRQFVSRVVRTFKA